MTIVRQMGVNLFQTEGHVDINRQTETTSRHEKSNSRFSQLRKLRKIRIKFKVLFKVMGSDDV